jgi:hypothetical protein
MHHVCQDKPHLLIIIYARESKLFVGAMKLFVALLRFAASRKFFQTYTSGLFNAV